MRSKVEVPKDEFDKFLKDNPSLHFDGRTYTQREEAGKGTVWFKPVAFQHDEKFYLVKEL